MRTILLLLLTLTGFTIAAPADAKRIKNFKVNFGEVQITWRDFLSISQMHKKEFPQKSGESIYMFVPLVASGKELSFDRLIELSEQAVEAEKKCQWLGYDKALDQKVRALGKLASQTDTRLFFAKVRCK